jgi:hypothetical protein
MGLVGLEVVVAAEREDDLREVLGDGLEERSRLHCVGGHSMALEGVIVAPKGSIICMAADND